MLKLYDPRTDLVFRKIFGMHKNICMSFLNALLPLSEYERIESIEYQDPEVFPEGPDHKNPLLVVRCTDSIKRTFLVEIQMLWADSFFNCSLFHASQAFVGQCHPGMTYGAFQPVYSLCILNDNLPGMMEFEDEYIHNFYIQNEHHSKVRMKGMVFVFVELMKFKSAKPLHNRLTDLWLRFLTFVETEKGDSVPEEFATDPDVKAAVECLKNMQLTEAERHEYFNYWEYISYLRSLLVGKFEEGILKKKKEIIEAMLEDGLDINTIARYSRMPVEKVKRIVDEIRNQE